MVCMAEEDGSISQSDYWDLAHAALGPVLYASLGSGVLALLTQEPCQAPAAALIGLASSAPSVLLALSLRWLPPCQFMKSRCLSSLGKVQHFLKAALYGASNGVGQLTGVAPSMSITHVMLASEIGVAASMLSVGLGFVLKGLPRQCRVLQAKYWPSDHDMVRMPNEEVGSWWPHRYNHSALSDRMLADEALDWQQKSDLRGISVF